MKHLEVKRSENMVYTVNIPADHTDCRATQSVKKAGLPESAKIYLPQAPENGFKIISWNRVAATTG